MIKLTIFNPDLTVYWIECFNNQQDADLWLAEEMTRSYWNSEFTYKFEGSENNGLTAQDLINQKALSYLSSTDWYVVRALETNEPIPEDIKQKRQEARNSIVKD